MGMYERVLESCKNQNITVKTLEKSLNLGNGTIRKWNTSFPSCDRALKVANFLHISFEWLVTGKYPTQVLDKSLNYLLTSFDKLSDADQNKVLNFIEISLIENVDSLTNNLIRETPNYNIIPKNSIPALGYVAAGSPIEAIENILTFVETDIPNVQFALYAKGESMAPVILNGDIIFVHKAMYIENGEIGIIKIDDDVTCKKFYDYADRIELLSINPDFEPIIHFKNSFNNLQIIGKVILTASQKARF